MFDGFQIRLNVIFGGCFSARKSMDAIDVLKKLFEQHFHTAASRIQPLQGSWAAQGGRFIRLASDRASAIGILYNVREENAAFLDFSRHLRRYRLPYRKSMARTSTSALISKRT